MNWVPTRRCLSNLLVALVAVGNIVPAGTQAAESSRYRLKRRQSYNEVADVRIDYAVQGALTFPAEKRAEKLALEVTAKLAYQDRLLMSGKMSAGDDLSQRGDAVKEGMPSIRAARYYDQVDVEITINGQKMAPELRDDRRLLGVSRRNAKLTYHCPLGSLSREEYDLIYLPCDLYALPLILPDEPVSIGSTWQQDDSALAALLGLDTVGESDVVSELKNIERGYAKVELSGNIQGAIAGVASEIAIKARYYFDLRRGKIASLQLVARERRGIGHVNPGVEATSRLKMTIEPRTDSDELSDRQVASMRGSAVWENQRLAYHSASLGIALEHDQNWFVTAEDDQATVLRRMDRGELIAQCNVSVLPSLKKGKAVTLAQFQEDMRKNLDTNFGTFVNARESTTSQGYLVYRVEAAGTASQLPVRLIYYLLTDTEGRRVALVFTMEGDLVKPFGSADRQIVESLAFVERELPENVTPSEDSSGQKVVGQP